MGSDNANPGESHRVAAVVGMDGWLITPSDFQVNDPPFALFRSEHNQAGNEEDGGGNIDAVLAAAAADGVSYEVHVVPGTSHNTLLDPPHDKYILARAVPFLRRHLACN